MSTSQREGDLTKEATMIMFDEFREASKAAKVLNELNQPNIPKVLALLGKKDEDGPAIVVERIHPTTLKEWLEYEQGIRVMWIVNRNNGRFLAMEPNHHRVFMYTCF